jgi:hypothetical protein
MNLTRESPRYSSFSAHAIAFLLLACSVIFFVFMDGCTSTPHPPQSVTVAVSSTSSSVLLGKTLQFTATVTGTSDTAVTWSVNNITGGNSTVGTITNAGLYTAPTDLPNPASISVQATSQADPTKSASSAVNISSDVTVTVATVPPNTISIEAGTTLQLTATVTSAGNPDKAVTWSVNGIPNGNSGMGTMSSTGLNATYAAPTTTPNPPNVNIQASSVADPSKSCECPFDRQIYGSSNRFPESSNGPNECCTSVYLRCYRNNEYECNLAGQWHLGGQRRGGNHLCSGPLRSTS